MTSPLIPPSSGPTAPPWTPASSASPAEVPDTRMATLEREVVKLRTELEALPHHMQLFNPTALEAKNKAELEAAAAEAEKTASTPPAEKMSQEQALSLLRQAGLIA